MFTVLHVLLPLLLLGHVATGKHVEQDTVPVPHLHVSELSLDRFLEDYARRGIPVVLQGWSLVFLVT